MLQIAALLLTSASVSQVDFACQPSESTKNDLRTATKMVQRLPELATWTKDKSVFDTGKRTRINGKCYEAIYVYSIMESKDLHLSYVFAVNISTNNILFVDIGKLEAMTLKEWRLRLAHGH
ncbi:hypothetical protein [Undibacterium flavidum]|uniref:Uncharacterized protein n=1 Tax=Undibacterium flavidum TaxID=2762297 RepID=A0ABR6YAI3_9BURK|nr:hypothetical protein [Undibacterium flavidum]MBC3873593.1 hypothetical protein [Undibacterium flavidum]